MLERLQEILGRELEKDPKEITGETVLLDEFDSLELFELVVTLEDEFRVHVPDRDIPGFVTVNDIAVYLENH